jgi:hemolysin D
MKSAEGGAPVLALPGRGPARSRAELEFLPAALEIIETPTPPLARAIAWSIVAFFAAAIAWASLGEIDIIASAPGRIVPTGRVKIIQPFEIGVVRAVHVHEGDRVKAGDVLVELDPTINAAERDRVAGELMAAELDAARLKAVLADAPASFAPPAGAADAAIAVERTLLGNQLAEYHAKLAALDRQIAQSEANRAAVAATVQKLTVAIPLLQQRADARKYLAEREVGSKLQYLEVQQDLVEHQQELQVQKARLAEAGASLAALGEQRRQAQAEFQRTNLADLAQAEQKVRAERQELIKAAERDRLQTLTAPVDGTVQQIAVHTVGGVVQPAEQLMVIVPAESRLEIEATVSNRDIGFVHAGQKADIKVDTFDFTRYGLLHGEVVSLSQDAVPPRDKAVERADQGNSAAEDGGKAGEPGYVARISLDRAQMQVGDKLVNLGPGMAVTVEIKTGRRRIIEYLLSPLLRANATALRER